MPETPKEQFSPDEVDDLVKYYGKPLKRDVKDRLMSKLKAQAERQEDHDAQQSRKRDQGKGRSR